MRRLVAALILSLGHCGPLLTYRRYSQPTKLDSLNAPLVGENCQLVILQIWLLPPQEQEEDLEAYPGSGYTYNNYLTPRNGLLAYRTAAAAAAAVDGGQSYSGQQYPARSETFPLFRL